MRVSDVRDAVIAGRWTCIQDFYAVGPQPQTGCGAKWKQKETA